MVIDIWENIIKGRSRLSKKMDIMQAIINVLDEHFDEFADEDETIDTRTLKENPFVERLKEELMGMREENNVTSTEIGQFLKFRYNNWLNNFLSRGINSPRRRTGYHFFRHSGGSHPKYSHIARLKSIEKEDWRKKASEDFRETSDELMALQQLLFYMEELLKMLRQPEPDIPEIIRFLEYNVETMREEYT